MRNVAVLPAVKNELHAAPLNGNLETTPIVVAYRVIDIVSRPICRGRWVRVFTSVGTRATHLTLGKRAAQLPMVD